MEKEIIARELLDILACPACKQGLAVVEHTPGQYGLQCPECKKTFPVRDGIPVMLLDEAIPPTS